MILIAEMNAQIESLDLPGDLEYQIESYLENIGEEVDFDYNTLFEVLNYHLQKPLNLNNATDYQLENLSLLNDSQVASLLAYRDKNGDLLAVYELQAVPNFDLPTIYRILPFVTVNRSLDDLNESFGAILEKSKKTLYLRWNRNLEVPQGYKTNAESGKLPSFEGDINKYYVRYSQTYENRISFGITMEKDPGESFFDKSNKQGFDFLSGHFMYKKVNKTIDRLVIGDFRSKFGQGLILNTGFSPGKSAFVNSLRRSGATLNRFSSVNEQNYLRGIGATLKLSKQLSLSTFVSNRKRDGNAISVDTTDAEVKIQNLSSLQFSGLHRTESEIEKENTLQQLNAGSSLKYKAPKGHIALNILYTRFDRPVGKSDKPYNRYFFRGQQLLNASIDYTYLYKNLVLFGETAWSDNHRFASVNGIIAPINNKIAFSIHYRFLPRDFQSLFGQTFSETSGVGNENGLYMGLEIRPSREWRLTAYVDNWRHPWLRFRSDAPARGSEYFARVSYYKKRDIEAFLQWKFERKQESYRLDYTNQDELLFKQKTNIRFQVNKKINKRLEMRSRLEWSLFDIEEAIDPAGLISYNGAFRPQSEVRNTGFLAYQDIIYKPVFIPFSFSTRFAIFDIATYDARIYAFENDVSYQFSVPAYYNKGTRFYGVIKYRAKKHLTLEARYAQTYWANQDQFGSGSSLILGQTRSEVKVQARWRF